MRLVRDYLRYPRFAGKNGGGGNRTRVGGCCDTRALQEICDRMATAASAEAEFVETFEALVYEQRAELERGEDTNLYFAYDPANDALKVGVARNVFARLDTMQTGNPSPLLLAAAAPGTVALERLVHGYLGADRIRGEWFRATPRVLAIAEQLLAAGQVCALVDEHEGGPVDVGDTIEFLARVWFEAELYVRQQAA